MAGIAPHPRSGREAELPPKADLAAWLDRKAWREIIIAIPYVWLLFFFLAALLHHPRDQLRASAQVGIPPVDLARELALSSPSTITALFSTRTHLLAGYLNSLTIAGIATFFCLLIGYPMALGIARAAGAWRNVLLLLVILPFWTSFLLRVYAWIGLLGNNSWFNQGLTSIYNTFFPFGPISTHIQMMNTNFAVVLGIVYSYLPFMILPLYATLERLDYTLNEAAMDLGSQALAGVQGRHPALVDARASSPAPCWSSSRRPANLVIPTLMGRADSPMIGRVHQRRVLPEPRLADGLGGRGGAAAAAGRADHDLQSSSRPSEGGGAQMKQRSTFLLTCLVFGYAFFYIPILSMIFFSFNKSRLATVWGGFSTRMVRQALREPAGSRRGLLSLEHRRRSAPPSPPFSAPWPAWRSPASRASAAARCFPASSRRRSSCRKSSPASRCCCSSSSWSS